MIFSSVRYVNGWILIYVKIIYFFIQVGILIMCTERTLGRLSLKLRDDFGNEIVCPSVYDAINRSLLNGSSDSNETLYKCQS